MKFLYDIIPPNLSLDIRGSLRSQNNAFPTPGKCSLISGTTAGGRSTALLIVVVICALILEWFAFKKIKEREWLKAQNSTQNRDHHLDSRERTKKAAFPISISDKMVIQNHLYSADDVNTTLIRKYVTTEATKPSIMRSMKSDRFLCIVMGILYLLRLVGQRISRRTGFLLEQSPARWRRHWKSAVHGELAVHLALPDCCF